MLFRLFSGFFKLKPSSEATVCKHHPSHLVNLGFTEVNLPAGSHICQIFSTDQEREDSLLRFLSQGLKDGERTACFSEKTTQETLRAHFRAEGISLEEVTERGDFALDGTRQVYFQGGIFDPDRMLGLLEAFHRASETGGYTAARVIGEMTDEIGSIAGGSRLLEYEARVSILLREHPVTAVCQYDARSFGGAQIMDVLKVHPMMLVRGAVVQNPFFVNPEDILSHA